eukprot:285694-Chlamydomonas_euryale.AAC.2
MPEEYKNQTCRRLLSILNVGTQRRPAAAITQQVYTHTTAQQPLDTLICTVRLMHGASEAPGAYVSEASDAYVSEAPGAYVSESCPESHYKRCVVWHNPVTGACVRAEGDILTLRCMRVGVANSDAAMDCPCRASPLEQSHLCTPCYSLCRVPQTSLPAPPRLSGPRWPLSPA